MNLTKIVRYPLLLLLLAYTGCGGSQTNNSFITSITVSPSASILSGGEVIVTAAVKDNTLFRTARWVADGGTLAVSTGLTTRWVSPAGLRTAADYTLTLRVEQTNGLSDLETVKIHVEPGSGSTSGARITGSSASAATARPGDVITATVTVANQADVAEVRWTSDVGSFITDRGYSVQWRAPSSATGTQEALLTVTSVGRNGDSFVSQIRILLQGTTTTGTTTTGTTTSGTTTTDTTTSGTTTVGTTTAGTTTIGTTTGGTGPTILRVTANPSSVRSGLSSALTVEVANPAEVAAIDWQANGGTLTNQQGSLATWTAPEVVQNTTYFVTVTVRNFQGFTTSQVVEVVAQPRT